MALIMKKHTFGILNYLVPEAIFWSDRKLGAVFSS